MCLFVCSCVCLCTMYIRVCVFARASVLWCSIIKLLFPKIPGILFSFRMWLGLFWLRVRITRSVIENAQHENQYSKISTTGTPDYNVLCQSICEFLHHTEQRSQSKSAIGSSCADSLNSSGVTKQPLYVDLIYAAGWIKSFLCPAIFVRGDVRHRRILMELTRFISFTLALLE